MWILLVFIQLNSVQPDQSLTMQEFTSQETCQAAGAKIWKFTAHKSLWSCVKK